MLLKFYIGWWEVPIFMDNPIWRASWYKNEGKALPWAGDVANPAVITFIDFSKTFDSAALPRSPPPHPLSHWQLVPASRLCRAVASRHQEGSWHVPTKPSSNQSICCAIHNNNTNYSWPRKGVSGVQNWPLNKTAFLALSLEIWLVQMRNTTCHQVERLTTIQLMPIDSSIFHSKIATNWIRSG